MKKIKLILLAVLITVVLGHTSCMVTKTNVGQYKEMQGIPYKYSKAKQLWLFWGILPLGKASANTPASGNCQVVTKYTLGDVLITTLTAGIIKSYTIKVKTKDRTTNHNDPSINNNNQQ